eukprot:2897416-Pleurochrysis_carterae.AAC.1
MSMPESMRAAYILPDGFQHGKHGAPDDMPFFLVCQNAACAKGDERYGKFAEYVAEKGTSCVRQVKAMTWPEVTFALNQIGIKRQEHRSFLHPIANALQPPAGYKWAVGKKEEGCQGARERGGPRKGMGLPPPPDPSADFDPKKNINLRLDGVLDAFPPKANGQRLTKDQMRLLGDAIWRWAQDHDEPSIGHHLQGAALTEVARQLTDQLPPLPFKGEDEERPYRRFLAV